MKATSRRRLLVSSVAMLLVAMLALGTATYAWFTTSTSATASKLTVRTVKASELQLSSTTIGWTDTLEYNVDKVLKPASSANGNDWFIADATDKDGTAGTVTQIAKTDSGFGGYVFADQLNVKNNGEATVQNVKISFTLSETKANDGNYLRLALVEATERKANATHKADTFAQNVYGAVADSAPAFTSTAKATTVVSAKSGSNVQFNVGDLIGKSATASDGKVNAKYYNLYIWFEGQDEDCKDANAGNVMPEITFSVSGDTVQA